MVFYMQKLKAFFREEDGVSSIEYALLASLIAAAIVVTVSNLGTAVLGLYETVTTKLAAL